jgi:AcrR family transcriptional regulator
MPRGSFDRSERRARTRAQLLSAAARVYARRGFDGATLDEVAEEAGFTKGAVYDHFGSKENLLFALLDEHLSGQIAEQIALFDPTKSAAERPRAGSDQWMRELDEDPNAFRLFVEAWVHGQRDEELGKRVAVGIEEWRGTLRAFGQAREQDLETEISADLLDQVANVMLGLGIGFGMVELGDPGSIPPRLLGAMLVLLLGTLETSEDARQLLEAAAAPSTPSNSRLRSTPPV